MGGSSEWLSVLYLLGALLLIGPAAFRRLRHNRRAPVYLAAWLGIAVLLALGYRLFAPV